MRPINTLVVHCSFTPPSMDIGVSEIDQWHKEKGWSGIGYHYVIRRNGTIEFGRPEEEVGAHCRGHNTGSLGVCLAGGMQEGTAGANPVAETNFTEAQYESLRFLLKHLSEEYNIKQENVFGHCELDPHKECPVLPQPARSYL